MFEWTKILDLGYFDQQQYEYHKNLVVDYKAVSFQGSGFLSIIFNEKHFSGMINSAIFLEVTFICCILICEQEARGRGKVYTHLLISAFDILPFNEECYDLQQPHAVFKLVLWMFPFASWLRILFISMPLLRKGKKRPLWCLSKAQLMSEQFNTHRLFQECSPTL